jgi:hypothetical protein
MNGAAAGAAAAAVARAVKASGVIVRVDPGEFLKLLDLNAQGLVVHAIGGIFSRRHKYLMGFKGLAFYTSVRQTIDLPGTCQIIEAKEIWITG